MNIKASNENGMSIDELIKRLHYIKFMHGDIPITFATFNDETILQPILNIRKTKGVLFQYENFIAYQEKNNLLNDSCINYNSADIIVIE